MTPHRLPFDLTNYRESISFARQPQVCFGKAEGRVEKKLEMMGDLIYEYCAKRFGICESKKKAVEV